MVKQDYGKVKVPNKLLFCVDALVEDQTLGFRSRAEFVNEAIRDNLKRYTVIHTELLTLMGWTEATVTSDMALVKALKGQGAQGKKKRYIEAQKVGAQMKLDGARQLVTSVRQKLKVAEDTGNKTIIDIQKNLLKEALKDVDYWSDVVAGKR